jgi:membrane-associated phospholipid phosphatase
MGSASYGFGHWQAQRNLPAPINITLWRVPGMDRVATRLWNPSASTASDVFFGAAVGASVATALIAQQGDRPFVPLVIMAESGLLCAGLTNSVKELARRPRPYLYNAAVPIHSHGAKEDRASFWSGHTANTAAITFSCASLVQRSGASRGLKAATWAGAAMAPAAMGYLRVRSGEHFPTDVLTGYLVGALVGTGVTYFHRTGKKPRQ